MSIVAVFFFAALALLSTSVQCNMYNNEGWSLASATWYGSRDGAGTDGGACGYGNLVSTPYGSVVSAASPVLFSNGFGCGTCFQVKCLNRELCSPEPVNIVITDECPGCAGSHLFDMSGTAFGRMAMDSDKVNNLLNYGAIDVVYKRIECEYNTEKNVAFQVAPGATEYWFSVVIRYLNGPGDLRSVQLKQAGTHVWQEMQHVWGANWALNAGPLKAPFSIRLRASDGEHIVARKVIPANWNANSTYTSQVNFRPEN